MDANKQAFLRKALENAYVHLLCFEVSPTGAPARLVVYEASTDCYVAIDAGAKNPQQALDMVTKNADCIIRKAPATWDGLIDTMHTNGFDLVIIGEDKSSIYSIKDIAQEYQNDSGAKKFWGPIPDDMFNAIQNSQRPARNQTPPTAPAKPTPPPPPPQPVAPTTAPTTAPKVTSSDANTKVANAFKNSGDLLNQLSQSAASKKETTNKVQQAFNNSDFFKNMSGGNK